MAERAGQDPANGLAASRVGTVWQVNAEVVGDSVDACEAEDK
jgi:hypothetical protein